MENYTVFVKLMLQNELSKGLLLASGQFSRLNKEAALFQARLNSIKTMGLIGGGLLFGGIIGFGLIDKMIKPASEYQHQLAQLNNSGLTHLEILKAQKVIWDDLKEVPTSSVSENIEAIRHLRMVFGGTKENFNQALEYVPTIQKIQSILRSVKGSDSSDESYELAKALELKGAVKDPQLFVTQADEMTKAIVASGGKVTGSDFLMAMKYGRAAAQGWNDQFTYTILPTLIQEMKTRSGGGGAAGGPGNALQSMYAAVVGGTISQKSLVVWHKLGLLDSSKEVWNKVGSLKGVEPGGVKNWNEFMASPFQWSQDTLLPALVKAGYKTQQQQMQAIQYLFPNRTASFIAMQMVEQGWKFKRDQALIGEAKGLGGYQTLLKEDPMLASMAIQKQWDTLMAILGYQVMPQLLNVATDLISDFTSLSKYFNENKTQAKLLVYSLVGLASALTISGTLLLLTAGFRLLWGVLRFIPPLLALTATSLRGMLTPLILMSLPAIGIAAALGLIAYGFYKLSKLLGINWLGVFSVISDAFTNFWHSIKSTNWTSLFNDIINSIINFAKLLAQVPGMIGGAIKNMLGIKSNFLVNPNDVTKKGGSQSVQVQSSFFVDGKKLADGVTHHQVNSASSVPNNTARFDTGMTYMPTLMKLGNY